jgi:hypothetical protein
MATQQYTTIKRRTTINKKDRQQKQQHMHNNQAGGGGILCTGFCFWLTLGSLSLLDSIFVHRASQQSTIIYNKNNTNTTNAG